MCGLNSLDQNSVPSFAWNPLAMCGLDAVICPGCLSFPAMERGQVVTQGLFSSSHLEEFAADSSCVASTGGAQQECAGTAASVGTLLPLHRSPCQAHFVTLGVAEGLSDFHVQQYIRKSDPEHF